MTPFGDQLRALADKTPVRADELRELATKFENAALRLYGPNGTKEDAKRLLGAWARARRAYCDITGERLI